MEPAANRGKTGLSEAGTPPDMECILKCRQGASSASGVDVERPDPRLKIQGVSMMITAGRRVVSSHSAPSLKRLGKMGNMTWNEPEMFHWHPVAEKEGSHHDQ